MNTKLAASDYFLSVPKRIERTRVVATNNSAKEPAPVSGNRNDGVAFA